MTWIIRHVEYNPLWSSYTGKYQHVVQETNDVIRAGFDEGNFINTTVNAIHEKCAENDAVPLRIQIYGSYGTVYQKYQIVYDVIGNIPTSGIGGTQSMPIPAVVAYAIAISVAAVLIALSITLVLKSLTEMSKSPGGQVLFSGIGIALIAAAGGYLLTSLASFKREVIKPHEKQSYGIKTIQY